MLLRNRILALQKSSLFTSPSAFSTGSHRNHSFLKPFSQAVHQNPNSSSIHGESTKKAPKNSSKSLSDKEKFVKKSLYIPPGIVVEDVTEDMILPGSNIIIGPYAGHSQIKQVEFVKSSSRAKDCPKVELPEFAIIGRSNVGKSSLINALVRKKEVALTSKKPGKTQFINHFLVNKSWYIVDLPGYGFANAPDSVRSDWTSFTKGYFLKRDTLVCVLLLVDASIPPQQIDFDCANWLGRNDIRLTYVFTKCDKSKPGKGSRPEENIRDFHALLRKYYPEPPPWIMTSSVTGLGRDELLLHLSQLRNYWESRE